MHDEKVDDSSRNVQQCSVFETTCNLVSVITGSGMLSLPFAAANMGWSVIITVLGLGAIFIYTFDLLARSIDVLERQSANKSISIDYVTFGTLAFGSNGYTLVFTIFSLEMLLALISFLINISINLQIIFPSISLTTGILGSAALAWIFALQDMRLAAYASAFGLCMTALIVCALLLSGAELGMEADSADLGQRRYKLFSLSGVPLSVGLIAFCFGGHGAL